jgi:hypothetical protein
MADVGEVQVHIDARHKQCIQALKRIALLADTGSDEHKAEFSHYYRMGDRPSGWRVAESMRQVANDTIGFEHGE